METGVIMKILIIEDDKNVRDDMMELLRNASYEVFIIEEFNNVLDQIININPDLVLLDINIPNMNGEMVLEKLRKISSVPVIMVTSKNTISDEVLSMGYGADDYVTKPYNPTILLLRINSILRRINNVSEIVKYKDAIVNIKKGTINYCNKEIILTKNEMIILGFMLSHKGVIVTRDELMTDLWDNNEYINDNALTVNISRLRSKLESIGLQDVIETRKGQGYILL